MRHIAFIVMVTVLHLAEASITVTLHTLMANALLETVPFYKALILPLLIFIFIFTFNLFNMSNLSKLENQKYRYAKGSD